MQTPLAMLTFPPPQLPGPEGEAGAELAERDGGADHLGAPGGLHQQGALPLHRQHQGEDHGGEEPLPPRHCQRPVAVA